MIQRQYGQNRLVVGFRDQDRNIPVFFQLNLGDGRWIHIFPFSLALDEVASSLHKINAVAIQLVIFELPSCLRKDHSELLRDLPLKVMALVS